MACTISPPSKSSQHKPQQVIVIINNNQTSLFRKKIKVNGEGGLTGTCRK
ncbi:hypothetical protein Hanom_Chr10g00906541 [Helianthus anomalus]